MSAIVKRLNAALEGRYRVESEIGEGGMATVFLADDIKHDRKVALKVLKPELAAVVGAERFLAEIRTTANLEDPHILPLYDSGEADSFLFYVMPYVEGDTLRERLQREHQLPVDEAVAIAKKVAGALSYAHQQGIVHRDVKPANILLRRGEPLVADFGIALALSEAGGGRITETGLSMGTPHYMSPEQAAGERSLDPRSDVYALGCVLFEMLTGEPPHAGPTGQAVLAKILTDRPRRITELRRAVPPNVDAAVARALEKLPADRMASASEFVEALDDPGFRHGGDADEARGAGRGPAVWKAATAVLGATTIALAVWLALPDGPAGDDSVFRAVLKLPENQELLTAQLGSSVALSPDGRQLVYTGSNPSAPWQFWLREADALEATPLPGTEASWSPVFSPGGGEVAFVNPESRLEVLSLDRGSIRTLADSAVQVLDWTPEGQIYYFRGVTLGDVWRIDAAGGEVEPVPVVSGGTASSPPWGPGDVMPGGRGMVITQYAQRASGAGSIMVAAVDFDAGSVTALIQGSNPRYLDEGYLLWASPEGDLMAAPFDPDALAITGPAIPVASEVLLDATATMHYAVSASGSLVYRTGVAGGARGGLVWLDREGAMTTASDIEVGLTVGLWDAMALSPDGSRVALSLTEGTTSHIWVENLDVDAPPSRVTFNGTLNVRPRWTPDGSSLTYVTNAAGSPTELWRKSADGRGSPEVVVRSAREVEEGMIGPDGEWAVYRLGGTFSNRDIFGRRLGRDTTDVPLVASAANERAMLLSPDGRWMAYVSDETGRDEVFVRPFPDVSAGKWQVSSGGGSSPVWGKTGAELFYIGASNFLTAARYRADGGSFTVTGTEPLFSTNGFLIGPNTANYDVAPDDSRFLMLALGSGASDLVWVHNWIRELRAMGTEGGQDR